MSPILPEGKWRVWVRNNPSYDPLREKTQGLKPETAFRGVSSAWGIERFFGKPMTVKK